MLNEFDQYLDKHYLGDQARKDRWTCNESIRVGRPIATREKRQWIPGVLYCRYADDFVIIVKGTKAHAEAIRGECSEFLSDKLKLTLNMDKTHITHVNDGFVFLGHRLIRKRGPKGTMRVVTGIPKVRARNFLARLTQELSSNYDKSPIDVIGKINRQLRGWANFYQFTDYTATVYHKVDWAVFWNTGVLASAEVPYRYQGVNEAMVYTTFANSG